MRKKTVGFLVAVLAGGLLTSSGCIAPVGGCHYSAEPLRMDPPIECLALRSETGCNQPDITGTNNCNQPLTFPPQSRYAVPIVFEPGQHVHWSFSSDPNPPGIFYTGSQDNKVYGVDATLGSQRVTLTVPTHHDG